MISSQPFTCIKKVSHCIEYYEDGEEWRCLICEGNYDVSSSGLCDEWKFGYEKAEVDSLVCKLEIDHCIEYDLIQKNLNALPVI